MKNISIIDLNYDLDLCSDLLPSFIYRLHEDLIFDTDLLNDLIDSTIKISKEGKNLCSEYITKLFKIYSYIIESLLAHFKQNDCYHIKNLHKNYWIYVERFKFVIECYFTKNYQSILEYEDELGKLVD